MRYAVVSDIHANIRAWRAIRADYERVGVDDVLCLGDLVGYGPQPVQLVDEVFEVSDNIILGNHDAVVGNQLDPEIFNDEARMVIEWTHGQFSDHAQQVIGELPHCIVGETFAISHADLGSPSEYGYIFETEDARPSFNATDKAISFVGHTHFPGIFRYDLQTHEIVQIPPQFFQLNPRYRYLVNTGSAGDPRDGDVRASYCIYDEATGSVEFRRVPFDLNAYQRDLHAVALDYTPYFIQIGLNHQEVSAENARYRLTQSMGTVTKAQQMKTVGLGDVHNQLKLHERRTRAFERRAGLTDQTVKKKADKTILYSAAAMIAVLLLLVSGLGYFAHLSRHAPTEAPALPLQAPKPEPSSTMTPVVPTHVEPSSSSPTPTSGQTEDPGPSTGGAPSKVYAFDDHFIVWAGQRLVIPAPGILANDAHQAGSPIRCKPENLDLTYGKLELDSDGSFVYTAKPLSDVEKASESFQYMVRADNEMANKAKLMIDVMKPTRATPVVADNGFILGIDFGSNSSDLLSVLASNHKRLEASPGGVPWLSHSNAVSSVMPYQIRMNQRTNNVSGYKRILESDRKVLSTYVEAQGFTKFSVKVPTPIDSCMIYLWMIRTPQQEQSSIRLNGGDSTSLSFDQSEKWKCIGPIRVKPKDETVAFEVSNKANDLIKLTGLEVWKDKELLPISTPTPPKATEPQPKPPEPKPPAVPKESFKNRLKIEVNGETEGAFQLKGTSDSSLDVWNATWVKPPQYKWEASAKALTDKWQRFRFELETSKNCELRLVLKARTDGENPNPICYDDITISGGTLGTLGNLDNLDFEDLINGNPTDWNPVKSPRLVVDSKGAKSGQCYAVVGPRSSWEQRFRAKRNRAVKISFWARTAQDGNSAEILPLATKDSPTLPYAVLDITGADGNTLKVRAKKKHDTMASSGGPSTVIEAVSRAAVGQAWQEYSITFTSGRADTLNLLFKSSGAPMDIDDVSIDNIKITDGSFEDPKKFGEEGGWLFYPKSVKTLSRGEMRGFLPRHVLTDNKQAKSGQYFLRLTSSVGIQRKIKVARAQRVTIKFFARLSSE
ncbi:hypothetical protein BVX99_03555 [bacterium F16]|nr:hypothetical protein BVX99_03555 [bacterium F16]